MNAIIDQGPVALMFALIIVHALADYPLQSAYMAKQKDWSQADSPSEWMVAMFAHCVIHAGGVWLITGKLYLGLVEFVLHALIDLGKGKKCYGLIVDQALHLACKLGYVIYWCSVLGP